MVRLPALARILFMFIVCCFVVVCFYFFVQHTFVFMNFCCYLSVSATVKVYTNIILTKTYTSFSSFTRSLLFIFTFQLLKNLQEIKVYLDRLK